MVRISWVTECVNRKEHVAEDEHLIDISGLFPSGVDPKVLRPSFVPYSSLTSILRTRSIRGDLLARAMLALTELTSRAIFVSRFASLTSRIHLMSVQPWIHRRSPSRWLGIVVETAERAATDSPGSYYFYVTFL